MKKKFRTTSFWLGLSGAVIIVLETISNIIGINLYSKEVEAIILSVCSALVMLGIVTKKDIKDENESNTKDLLEEINLKEINKDDKK